MKKIAWITDTTATLDEKYIKENDIHIISLNLIFGNETYKEEKELSAEEFYKKMRNENVNPKTSQPSIGDFVELYEKLKEEYEIGIAIHASASLTGTYNASVQAAEMAGFKLIAIDSKIGSYPLNKMVKMAIEKYKENESVEEVKKLIEEKRENTKLYLIPENLEQLKRSGRLSNGKAILASILKMNLIIKFDDGKVVLHEKVRTAKKLDNYLDNLIQEASRETDEICIIHADNEKKAQEVKDKLILKYPEIKFKTMILCPVAGVHLGYDSIGFGWFKN